LESALSRLLAHDLRGAVEEFLASSHRVAGEALVGEDLPDCWVVEACPQQRAFRAVAVLNARRNNVHGQQQDRACQ
jgi:hypothetical protein